VNLDYYKIYYQFLNLYRNLRHVMCNFVTSNKHGPVVEMDRHALYQMESTLQDRTLPGLPDK